MICQRLEKVHKLQALKGLKQYWANHHFLTSVSDQFLADKGIKNGDPSVASIAEVNHGSIAIKELQGQPVSVDTCLQLHKGAFSCSMELCNGLPTSRYLILLILTQRINFFCWIKGRKTNIDEKLFFMFICTLSLLVLGCLLLLLLKPKVSTLETKMKRNKINSAI